MYPLFYSTVGYLLQKCSSPVRDGSFDLVPIRKALCTSLGEASDSWYQRLQKLLILFHDSKQHGYKTWRTKQ